MDFVSCCKDMDTNFCINYFDFLANSHFDIHLKLYKGCLNFYFLSLHYLTIFHFHLSSLEEQEAHYNLHFSNMQLMLLLSK
jgi:hypothetical protein